MFNLCKNETNASQFQKRRLRTAKLNDLRLYDNSVIYEFRNELFLSKIPIFVVDKLSKPHPSVHRYARSVRGLLRVFAFYFKSTMQIYVV